MAKAGYFDQMRRGFIYPVLLWMSLYVVVLILGFSPYPVSSYNMLSGSPTILIALLMGALIGSGLGRNHSVKACMFYAFMAAVIVGFCDLLVGYMLINYSTPFLTYIANYYQQSQANAPVLSNILAAWVEMIYAATAASAVTKYLRMK